MRPVITQYSITIMGLHHYQKPQPFLKVNDKKYNQGCLYYFVVRYGPPVRTPWRITVENLSTRISWQVSEK